MQTKYSRIKDYISANRETMSVKRMANALGEKPETIYLAASRYGISVSAKPKINYTEEVVNERRTWVASHEDGVTLHEFALFYSMGYREAFRFCNRYGISYRYKAAKAAHNPKGKQFTEAEELFDVDSLRMGQTWLI